MIKRAIMKSIHFFFLFLATVLTYSCSNEKVQTEKYQRIISLAPNITEILYTLGLQDKLVAVSDYCKYPAQANEKEKVGGLFNPNLEKITALQPDLILATKSYKDLRAKINPMIDIILLPEKTIGDVYLAIDSIGVLLNKKSMAKKVILALQDSLFQYKFEPEKYATKAVLVLGRESGSTRNIGISGPGAFINELWEWCGGQNAFPEMEGAFVQLNREDLLKRDPDLIIEFKSKKNNKLDNFSFNKKEWQELNITAVKKGNIYFVNGNDFLIPGPRMFLLAKRYRQILTAFLNKKSM